MKIKYNAPVILTYTLTALALVIFAGNRLMAGWFSSPAVLSPTDPVFYIRSISYIFGHAGWSHLMGNVTIILLVGPLLEEKFGSGKLLQMIFITAITTTLLNAVFFSTSLIGGSGIAFMLILLSSFSNIRSGEIPLTFIMIAVLFIGGEVISSLKVDNISQFSHLTGGLTGAVYGFLTSRR